VALLAAGAASADGQTVDGLFDPQQLQELRVFINARDLADLRNHYAENTYYPVDVHWGRLRVRNAGIRSRGLGSRNPSKLGLHVEFGYYVSGQQFLGLRSIELDNLWQDPSMLREYAAMALFARMGQPAPREAFTRLYINEVYQGVYGIVETVDSGYLRRTLGDDNGFLFEYHWIDRYEFTDMSADLAAIRARFERRTHQTDSMQAAYAPVTEMIRAINTDGANWRASVEPYVDVRQFLAHVAIEQFLSELDGLTGYEGLNNFYLFRPAGSSRHQFLPWDRDHAFQDVASPIFQRAERNELLRRALAFEDLRTYYMSVLEECAGAAERDQWLEQTVVRAAALISTAAAEDPLKPYDDATRAAALEHLVEFARTRPAVVRAAVTRARAAGSEERR
jgi:spore coat protein CotH